MSASPEFYKPTAPAAFRAPPLPIAVQDDYSSSCCCRTPTGSGISYLKEPTTCPPAPRKPPPPPCKKRLFQSPQQPVISLRLHDLERIFQRHPQAKGAHKRPRPNKEEPAALVELN